MARFAAALVFAALTGLANAEEATPPKGTDRPAKILRSLDRMREQICLAKEQIDRLEREMQALREELAGAPSSEEPILDLVPAPPELATVAPPATVEAIPRPVPGSEILPIPGPLPSDEPGLLPAAGPTEVPAVNPYAPQSAFPPHGPDEEDDGKTPRTFPIRDPNFGSDAVGSTREYLLIVPPGGAKVVAFDKTTRRALSVTLSNDKTVRHEVTPVVGQSIIGLAVKGPKISRLAVFANLQPGLAPVWHPVELREPVDTAMPQVLDYHVVLYTLGRRVYAYSREAERWDVLELPKGAIPRQGVSGAAGPTFEHAGHIYTFGTAEGKWTDLDINAILDRAETPKK